MMSEFNQEEENQEPLESHEKDADEVDELNIPQEARRDRDRGVSWATG